MLELKITDDTVVKFSDYLQSIDDTRLIISFLLSFFIRMVVELFT